MDDFERLRPYEVFNDFDEIKNLIRAYEKEKGFVFVKSQAKKIETYNETQISKGLKTLPERVVYRYNVWVFLRLLVVCCYFI